MWIEYSTESDYNYDFQSMYHFPVSISDIVLLIFDYATLWNKHMYTRWSTHLSFHCSKRERDREWLDFV